MTVDDGEPLAMAETLLSDIVVFVLAAAGLISSAIGIVVGTGEIFGRRRRSDDR